MLCRHIGHDASVVDFTADLIVDFVEAQRASGISAASIRRRMSVLRIFAKWLADSQLLDLDPWSSQVSLEIRKPRRLPRALPWSELVA